MDDPKDGVERETVEVLGAEDELVREELADAQVRDSREQRVEVFGPRRHAADCSAGLLNSFLRMRIFRAALVALVFAGAPLAAAPATAPGRVVILGFDGVDAHVVEEMLGKGELPDLADLQKRGGYSPLTPTIPAQTPVSWATFSTGLDPGGHEIFDFLKRDPANRIPTFAVAEELQVPFLIGQEQSGGVRGRGVPAVRPSGRCCSRGGAGDSSRRSFSSSRSAAPAARSWPRRPGFPRPARGSATTGAGPCSGRRRAPGRRP